MLNKDSRGAGVTPRAGQSERTSGGGVWGGGAGFSAGIALVLLAASAVRVYNLGVPSLWWDEVLTAITSTFPPEYILKWTRFCEVHPPLFYLVTKAATHLGTSDAMLRLPWALTGVLQIFAVYLLCVRFISPRAGIASASLLAASPLHVLISRQLRPYPLILMLQTVSLGLFRIWLENPSLPLLLGLALINGATALLHYMGLGLVGVQILFCCAYFAVVRPMGWLKRCLWYCAANGAALMPGLYFFQTISIRNDMLSADPEGHVLGRLLLGLDGVFRPMVRSMALDEVAHSFTPAVWACLGVVTLVTVLGVRELWRRDRILGALMPFTLLGLMAMVTLSGQGFFRPRHLLPLFLPFFILGGCALSRLIPRRGFPKALALCLAAALPFACVFGKDAQLYSPGSFGKYRMEADAAAFLPSEDAVCGTSDQTLYNALNWYLDRREAPNPLRNVNVQPSTRNIRFTYLTESSMESLGGAERSLLDPFGPPSGLDKLYDLSAPFWQWRRIPVHAVESPQTGFTFDATPQALYRDSYRAQNILFLPKSRLAVATANDRPAELAYAFDLPEEQPGSVLACVRYRDAGPGNRFELRYALDDKPALTAFDGSSLDPGDLSLAWVAIQPGPSARRLVVSARLLTGRVTPDYPGDNLATNGLSRLRVDFLPRAMASPPDVESVSVQGLGELESFPGGQGRWAEGPRLRAVFNCPRAASLKLAMSYGSRYRELGVTITFNGKPVGRPTLSDPGDHLWDALSLDLDANQGRNVLEFAFDKYNHRPRSPIDETFAPADLRRLALIVHRFAIGNAEIVD